MIKVGIVGAGGYVAGELIRCLIHHPKAELDFLFSSSQANKKVASVHQDLVFLENLKFSNTINPQVDIVFLCLGHGNSKAFLETHTFSKYTKIIDMSNDFRLKKNSRFKENNFVYGLTELNKPSIKTANCIANPGCFATAIQLALLPLAASNLLTNDVHIHAITGSSGAGQGLNATSHFSWRNNNISIYKAFRHQHLGEVEQSISELQQTFDKDINFVPVRGNFTRGIFASVYTQCNLCEKKLDDIYQWYYQDSVFTHATKDTVHLKQVTNTNYCYIQVQKIEDKVFITSVIDNLLKGAAGQAIENMNLMFGFEQQMGLNLKANYF